MTDTTCPRCALGDFGRDRRSDGVKHTATSKAPSVAVMEDWMSESGAEATDGCWVEPDGICQHGHSSWLRAMGLI
jgi:hypothetical protein